jgi:hypothetical protein
VKVSEKLAAIGKVKEKAEAERLEFFHDSYRKAFATVPVGDHRETWKIRSRDFRLWVTNHLYDFIGFPPPKAVVNQCLEEFETVAICRGPLHEVHVRIAASNDAIHVDLANDEWETLNVTPSGWRVGKESPLKFRRPMGMTALPYPVAGANLREILRFINVRPQSESLLLTWLTYSLRPNLPYPILALSGVQGSGKSTITRVLRSLIDPSLAALTTTPKSERDVAIAATNSHLIAMDNLSEITPELSDIMCRVATGGSFRTRELYTNDEEMIFTYRRPLVINGIEDLPVRPDLLDRALLIHVEPIEPEKRRDERDFWNEFEQARPRLFGAVVDAVSAGLRLVDDVRLSSSPRMADFFRWGVAIEQHLGFPAGTFLAAYSANIEDANAAALEASPVAKVIHDFLSFHDGRFRGTALELLQALDQFIEANEKSWNASGSSQALVRKHPQYPKAANQLSAAIARVEPNLAKLGIKIQRGRNHGGRYVCLELNPSEIDARRDRGDDRDDAFVITEAA